MKVALVLLLVLVWPFASALGQDTTESDTAEKNEENKKKSGKKSSSPTVSSDPTPPSTVIEGFDHSKLKKTVEADKGIIMKSPENSTGTAPCGADEEVQLNTREVLKPGEKCVESSYTCKRTDSTTHVVTRETCAPFTPTLKK